MLTGGPLGVRMQAETAVPRRARSTPDDFRRLALRAAGRAPARDAAGRAGDEPHHRHRAEPRAARRRSARWPPGLAHELNNPAAAARRAAAQMAEALDVDRRRRSAASSSRGSSAREAEQLRRAAAARRSRGAERARRWTRSTPPTPRTSCSTRLEELGVPEPWRLAEPLAARRRRPGVARPGRRARRAGDRRGARAGSPRRSPRAASRPSCRSRPQRMSGARRRRQDLRLHGPRRAGRGRPARGARDDARRARPQAQAHARSRSCATTTARCRKLTVRGSELNQVWTNLLDNAIDALGEQRHDHDRDAPRRRLRASSRSPTTGPGIPPDDPRAASSTRSSRPRTSGTAPASAWRPRAGSSSTATTAR